MLGLLAPLSPATAAGESPELPTGKHPPWKTAGPFFVCIPDRVRGERTY